METFLLLFILNPVTTNREVSKNSATQKNCFDYPEIWTMWFYHRIMSLNDANGMTNSVDPDQTAPGWFFLILYMAVPLEHYVCDL